MVNISPALPQRAYGSTLAILTKGAAMPRRKNETLTIRTTSDIKDLLRQAAELEHRSLSSMIEVLVRDYARQAKLKAEADKGVQGE